MPNAPKPQPKPNPAPQPRPGPTPPKSQHDDKHEHDHDHEYDRDHDKPPSTREHDDAVKNPAPMAMPVAGVAPPEPGLTLGARPHDKRDPQSAKFEAHAAPPFWNAPREEAKAREEWSPDPALDAREQKPPPGYYADGMSAPDEQRARAAWVEQHGVKEYDEATDQRPDEDKPVFDEHALAGGGAFVTAGKQRQVPGVVPPTKRE